MRVSGAAEAAVWALVRANISSGDRRLRIVAEGLIDALKPPEKPSRYPGQLTLWRGLMPWCVYPQTKFDCEALNCSGMTIGVCVKRQVESEGQRLVSRPGHSDAMRGQSPDYPTCQTHLCAQGAANRQALSERFEITDKGPRSRLGYGRTRPAVSIRPVEG